MTIKEAMVSVLFPPRCPICDEVVQSGSLICQACQKEAVCIREPACKKCGKQLEENRKEYCADCDKKHHFYSQGKAVFAYQGKMRQSMYRFKYSNKREYAQYYAQEAVRLYGDWIQKKEIEAIVPVPMYRKKEKARGYNQAEVFARALGRKMQIAVKTDLLVRIRNTTPQKQLNEAERKVNLKKAFQVVPNIVKYKKVLLVDDIYTTGSTMDAAADVLMQAGAESVCFLCISIGEGY